MVDVKFKHSINTEISYFSVSGSIGVTVIIDTLNCVKDNKSDFELQKRNIEGALCQCHLRVP